MRKQDVPFDSLIRDHWPVVYRFVLRLVGDPHDAEDVTQQTFFRAFRAWRGFRGDASVRTWLMRIAIREAARCLRQRSGRPQALTGDVASGPPSRAGPEEAERHAALQAALARLRPIHRLVLTLFGVDGLSHADIALLLDCPEGTVWSRLYHARRALGAILDGAPEKRND